MHQGGREAARAVARVRDQVRELDGQLGTVTRERNALQQQVEAGNISREKADRQIAGLNDQIAGLRDARNQATRVAQEHNRRRLEAEERATLAEEEVGRLREQLANAPNGEAINQILQQHLEQIQNINLSQENITQISQNLAQQLNAQLGGGFAVGEGGIIRGPGGGIIYNPQMMGGGIPPELLRTLHPEERAALLARLGQAPAEAKDAIAQRIEALTAAHATPEQILKAIEEKVPPEEKKSGTKKFAEGATNIGGGIMGLFNPGIFSNLLLIVVLILLIWVVLNFFPMV
jgi:chromosome segregation ATPase